ncbi:MAG: alkyldihydroxyacetonephosphate synthase [Bradymonadia bacterium]|jgi:alkyldihydroxyacetonephosphate synthase
MNIDGLREQLGAGARVEQYISTRTLYSRDCWPFLNLHARAGAPGRWLPDAVVFPETESDVSVCVEWAREHRVPIVPYGGGSGVAGAAVPTSGGIIVDLKRLDSLELSLADTGLAWVGAGWLGARLEQALNNRGLSLGHFPSSLGCSTVGGYVATRSAGQLSTRHGKIEDLVVGLRVLLPSGQIKETFADEQDSAGLWLGSEGCLGIILSVLLRVESRPTFVRARGFAARSVEEGLDAMREVLHQGHRPAAMRLYDEFDTLISGARKAGRGQQKRPPHWLADVLAVDKAAARSLALRAATAMLSRVPAGSLLLNRAADRAYDSCLLIASVEEASEDVAEASSIDVFSTLTDRLQDLGTAPGDYWYAHRYAVSYKLSPLMEAGLFVDTMEVATSWTNLNTLYKAVKTAVAPLAFIMAHFSHAYSGGCSIYFTFAGFARDDDDALAQYERVWSAAQDGVLRGGGSLTHHHGVGIMKASRLNDDHNGAAPFFDRIKAQLDPDSLMNPGKLWHTPKAFP